MAILFAWGAWPSRALRPVIVSANALMWISAAPIGGHYLVDLLAGSAIAIGAIALTNRLVSRAAGGDPEAVAEHDWSLALAKQAAVQTR
jgi:membrane-associated phospholipid phosphatase